MILGPFENRKQRRDPTLPTHVVRIYGIYVGRKGVLRDFGADACTTMVYTLIFVEGDTPSMCSYCCEKCSPGMVLKTFLVASPAPKP